MTPTSSTGQPPRLTNNDGPPPTYTVQVRNSSVAAVVAALVLSGCTSLSPEIGATSVAAAPGPVSPSASPSASPTPAPQLPRPFPIDGALIDSASPVVAELHETAGGFPLLKVDLTHDQATLTALLPDESVASYRWSDGVISVVDSDIQYVGQATFTPERFPLSSAARMFDIADMRGVRGQLVLQIVEYREGQVLMTITSRPESTTVFFRPDGTAVAELGYTSVADLTAGIDEVVTDDAEAVAVGFNSTRGYWADLPEDGGTILSRSRMAGLPVFETRRNETSSLETFNPQEIDPATLAMVIARVQPDPSEQCDVLIDRSTQRSGAVVQVSCGGEVHYADLEGRDMTELITN